MKIIWAAWFFLFLVSFVCLESYAVETNKETLSRTVWETQDFFPAFGPILGIVIGFLLCHFFWGGVVSFQPVGQLMKKTFGE